MVLITHLLLVTFVPTQPDGRVLLCLSRLVYLITCALLSCILSLHFHLRSIHYQTLSFSAYISLFSTSGEIIKIYPYTNFFTTCNRLDTNGHDPRGPFNVNRFGWLLTRSLPPFWYYCRLIWLCLTSISCLIKRDRNRATKNKKSRSPLMSDSQSIIKGWKIVKEELLFLVDLEKRGLWKPFCLFPIALYAGVVYRTDPNCLLFLARTMIRTWLRSRSSLCSISKRIPIE